MAIGARLDYEAIKREVEAERFAPPPQPVTSSKNPLGTCGYCGDITVTTRTGKIRAHKQLLVGRRGYKRGAECPGGGEYPDPIDHQESNT
jgi:hypothetical protein